MQMTFIILLILSLFKSFPYSDTTKSQQTLNPDLLAGHTTYFSIGEGKFSNAENFTKLIPTVQFISLGEIHNSRRLSEFTGVLLKHAYDHGFKHLAVEAGPYSAQKLMVLAEQEPAAVTEFYGRYSSKLFDIYPVPFFTGQADLQFLKTAVNLEYDLWGLDQEFSFSDKYLINELARIHPSLSEKQKKLLNKINRKLWWWYRRDRLFSGFDLNCRIREYRPFVEYMDSFEPGNPKTDQIIEAIKKSLEIYCLAESGEWSKSNRMRIDYFKENFDRNYEMALETDSLPKVIVKMGSYHSGRDKSPLGIYDMGHHLQQLARQNGTKSLHLRFLNRYFEGGEDKMGAENYRLSTNFMAVGQKDRWALIDVRELRTQIKSGRLKASEFETREILNYDFIIIMPQDRRAVKHY